MRLLLALLLVLAFGHTSAVAKQKPNTLLDSLVMPAPQQVTFSRGLIPDTPDAQNYMAGADPATNTIYFQGDLPRSTKAHEVGHLFDYQVLSDGDRNFFTRLMGLNGPWDAGTGYSGLRSPSEMFADWYGNAANGHDGVHQWDSSYASPPDPKAYGRFERALVRLGKRRGLQQYQR